MRSMTQATRWWRGAAVQTKLTVVIMATCVAGLLLAFASIVTYEYSTARRDLGARLTGIADLIGATSTAAVQFRDATAGTEVLATFASAGIEAARIDLPDGQAFAGFSNTTSRIPAQFPVDGAATIGASHVVSRPIVLNGDTIGAIRVQGSLAPVHAQVRQYLLILFAVLVVASLIAYALATATQRAISGPILHLASVAEHVSEQRDYAIRARKDSDDEVGQLVERFNEMLAQIERRDEALIEAQAQLEARVVERTRTLQQEIEEHRRTENQLTLAKAAADEANVAKSAFLANMSHELRTPLNAIIGYGEMLREDADATGSADQVADLTRITDAGRHLLALINDVLDLSKIEAGRMELHIETFESADVIQAVLGTSQALAAARNNRLTASGLEHAVTMRSDRTRLQQVLLNLVSNACKFTSNGHVHVACARERGERHDWLVVHITDTGIGMTPDQIGRLFRDFMQADTSTTRKYGGTGLGLAISQRLSRLMGGTITARSEQGKGSTFSVRLPVAAQPTYAGVAIVGADELPASDRSPLAALQGDRASILVVDDDMSARELVVRTLKRAGFAATCTGSGGAAYDIMDAAPPDLLVLDLLLPDVNGWAFMERMHGHDVLRHVPVVVLSMLDNRSHSLTLGAVDHLVKPASARQLVDTVRAALQTHARPSFQDPGSATQADARKSA